MTGFKLTACAALFVATAAQAALVTNPNDLRSWQGADVGTFASLYYGANTLATRQTVVTNQLLDDSYFNPTGYAAGTLIRYNGGAPTSGSYGTSLDQPGVNDGGNQGTYNYSYSGVGANVGGNNIDANWIQTNNVVGHSVWDLGFQATKAAVFNTIDHGPLPLEAIESTVYLSNGGLGDPTTWTWRQAVTERVWLEGIYSDTSVLWDGFAYAVGTGTSDTFRYASVIWGGPGALLADGDNEINGIMGLRGDFTPPPIVPGIPEPSTYALMLAGLGVIASVVRRRRATG